MESMGVAPAEMGAVEAPQPVIWDELAPGLVVNPTNLRKEFEENGYLVLPRIYSPEECEKLRVRMAEMLHEFDPQKEIENHGKQVFSSSDNKQHAEDSRKYFLESGDKIRFFFEEDAFDEHGNLKQSKEQSINKVGHALHDLEPVFSEFSRAPALEKLSEWLGIEDPRLLQGMYIFKQPRIGGEVVPHQDATFLYTDPISCIGFWIALEPATKENGCLWAWPGSHKDGLRDGRRFVREGNTTTKFVPPPPASPGAWADASNYVPLEVDVGTLIVIHGCVVHMSYANTSEKSRQAYTLHVIEGKAKYPEDNWLQMADPPVGFHPATPAAQ
eukprot:TRINITY_DN9696_c1_g5_i3.p1 TRINITY_DN9696_c1_g5~~TRINITY_DN9696_c1_g5_i3.p1  ORF type:complete len:339 (+),score=62.85 TRINITY_DN9696_c1_g5_i3:33-1019(+)